MKKFHITVIVNKMRKVIVVLLKCAENELINLKK